MKTLDYWINLKKRVKGFYTDEQGRVRPVISVERDYREVVENQLNEEVIDYVRPLIERYSSEVGLDVKLPIVLTDRKADTHGWFIWVDILGDSPVLYVNRKYLRNLIEDPNQEGLELLEYNIAHELGRFKEASSYPVKDITGLAVELERPPAFYWGEKTAYDLSPLKTSRWNFNDKLREYLRRRGLLRD